MLADGWMLRASARMIRGRTVRLIVVSALLALGASGLTAPNAAAARGVDVRGSTTYTLVPGERAVRVSADLTVRNVTPDTAQVRYFYTGYGIGVHAEATGVRATRGGKTLKTSITARGGYKLVNVQFGTRLFRGQSFRFRVDYRLPDGGARSKSAIRVGRAFAGFYGYAFGEEAANVRIVLPAGFKVTTREGQRMASATDGAGRTVLTAGSIRSPAAWWVYIAADRPDALREETFQVTIGAERKSVTVRAWPEDDQWIRRVRTRLEGGLPILGELIGLPWPVRDTLEVVEVFTPLLGGYAGIFYEPESEIRITEDPNELVVLHEASHAWFNGNLAAERWINEGLADEYAARTLARLGVTGYSPGTLDRRAKEAFALNEWPEPRPVSDDQTEARERYGYRASWHVVRTLVGEIGEAGMRNVLKAAAADEIAYVGEGAPETVTGAPGADWRIFLDLLEERGASTTASSVFERWVVAAADAKTLDLRRDTRQAYEELVEKGGTWLPPYSLRLHMANWNFAAANDRITVAEEVLDERDEIAALARSLSVVPSDKLEDVYEGRSGELVAAARLADEQLATLQEMDGAADRAAAPREPIAVLGLVGDSPESALAQARQNFERDDLPGARAAASRATQLLESAAQTGFDRARLALAFLLLLVVAAAAFIVVRRRRRPAAVEAPATLPATFGQDEEGQR